MIRAALIWMTLLLAPQLADAAAVKVYSGEHENFSRIVLVFDQDVAWTKEEITNGYQLNFDIKDYDMDLSSVFEKIPKTRISGVSFYSETGVLTIETTEKLAAEIFSAGQNTIAIDIKDKPRPKSESSEGHRNSTSRVFPLGIPSKEAPRTTAPKPRINNTRVEALPAKHERFEGIERKISTATSELEEHLLKQLGRAASQGIANVATTHTDATPESHSQNSLKETDKEANDRHVFARTAFDAEEKEATSRRQGTQACYGDEVLSISDWLMDERPATAISIARRAMTSEFGVPSEDSVRRMAQTYIALGFGAEARATILESEVPPRNKTLLLEMSKIVDGHPSSTPIALRAGQACNGPTSLWSFISGASNESNPNYDSIHAAFIRLPLSLRTQVGALLVERLAESGNDSLANTIRSTISRTSRITPPNLLMLDAQSAVKRQPTNHASLQLQLSASMGTELVPSVMNLHLDTIRESRRIAPEDILEAEAIAFDHKGTTAGLELLEKIFLSWSTIGEFAHAINAWKEVERVSGPRPRPDVLFSEAVSHLLESKKDIEIGKLLHSEFLNGRSDFLDLDTTLSIVEWHLEYGDTKKVARLISGIENTPTLRYRQIRSRLAVLNGEYALALSFVAAEDDLTSRQLKAQALSGLGRHGAAASSLENLPDIEPDFFREAWLSGDTELIGKTGNSNQMEFVELSEAAKRGARTDLTKSSTAPQPVRGVDILNAEDGFVDATPAVGLNRRRAILSRSKDARRVIESLLWNGQFQ